LRQNTGIIEREVFIFRADPPGSMGEFAGVTRPDGVECDGFDADELAKSLGITADELIDLNRRKLLMAESRRVSTGLGADLTIEYDIRTPTNGIRQRVNRAAVKGKA
jgi:hypothetical protein